MSGRVAALVTVVGLLSGCTTFVPVPQDGGATWREARHAPYQPGTSRFDAKSATPWRADASDGAAPPLGAAPLPPASGATSFDPRPLPPLQTDGGTAALEDSAEAAWAVDARGYQVPVVRDAPVVEAAPPAPLVVPMVPAATEVAAAAPPPAPRPAPQPQVIEREAVPQSAAPAVAGIADAAQQGRDYAPPALSNVGFLWPVDGEVVDASSADAPAHATNGLFVVAPAGTPFVAAENGVVVFASDEMQIYGNMAVVRHDGDYTTAYGHAERLDVAKGDVVRRGQRLGLVGSTGAVDAPKLYFEMRAGSQVVDPRHYLMGSPAVASN